MASVCEWCGSPSFKIETKKVYWELPDGTGAIEITDTPTVCCGDCGMTYQTADTVKEIEDQLFLINTKQLSNSVSYGELMEKTRLLKRNYFDFSGEE